MAQADKIVVFSSTEERKHLTKIHDSVLDMVPGFRDQMSNFGMDPEALDRVIDVVWMVAFFLKDL
jgi:hypothetical protein